MLDLAGIEDLLGVGVRRGRLQILGELGHLTLEGPQRPEGFDVEHRHEAAVVVLARRLHAETEAGQDSGQDLDDRQQAVALVALTAAERQQHATGPERPRVRGLPPILVEERSEEHTSELQSLMRISYAVFCL